MYAVFEDGSHQYRVSEGDVVTIDLRQAEPGDRLELDNVLLYVNNEDLKVGQPSIDGMKVVAEVVDRVSKKVVIQKFRRRKNSRRLKGHRQWWTRVKIKHILLPGQSEPAKQESKPEPKEEKKEEPASAPTPEASAEAPASESASE